MARAATARTGRRRASAGATAGGVAFVLALAVAAAYLPALDAGFVAWDDDVYVTENPHLAGGLSLDTLRAVGTTTHTGNWIPLTWLSHALDRALYGLAPRGHHATALALHVANTVFLLFVLRGLTGALWPSAAVAALFGLHPLHVESVAWVSERKDVLSTLFWLLAIAAYARYARAPSRGRLLAVAALFVLGLLAKPMLVTLPLVLLLLDYWPLGRLSRAAVREKLPLAALALAFAAGAFVAQRAAGAVTAARVDVADRVANALVSSVRYLALTVWPRGLSPWYSHPAIEGPPLTAAEIGGAAALIAAVTVVAIAAARARPYLLVGWLWYLGTLVPVIGLVQIGAAGMADRYTYVPLIGIFIAVAWTVASLPLWRVTWARRTTAAAVGAILLVLGVLTWRQAAVWHDTGTLWAHTLAVNPRAAVAHYALAVAAARERRPADAVAHYRRAVEARPDVWNWHAELGDLLWAHGRAAAAEPHYRRAVELNPAEPVVRNSLANVLTRLERSAEARRELETALALRPDFVEARNNLGILLANEGDLAGAVAAFEAALAVRPDFHQARGNLAAVRAELEERAEGEGKEP